MMSTTTVSKRTKSARHKARGKQSAFRSATAPAPNEEVQRLRDQILQLRATVTEQEQSIEFLRDLLSQRWFDAD